MEGEQISPWVNEQLDQTHPEPSPNIAIRPRKYLQPLPSYSAPKQPPITTDYEGPVHRGNTLRMTRCNSITELDWKTAPSTAQKFFYQTSSSTQLKAAPSLLAHKYFSRHESEGRAVPRIDTNISNSQTKRMKSRLEALLKQNPRQQKLSNVLPVREPNPLLNKRLKDAKVRPQNIVFAYEKVQDRGESVAKKRISHHILDRLLDCWQ